MNNSLKIFNYSEKEIRTQIVDGQPWFCGKDVCNVLTIVKHTQALQELDEDERGTYKVDTPGGKQKLIFVSESGLYSLIFSSNKPEAKKFKKWVTSEVLPSIRKNGSYSLRDFILTSPTKWERTFPEEFFRQVLKVYNYTYTPSQGTPQFVGKFIDKYIYSSLDKGMTKSLKVVRNQHLEITDEFSLLHQFLNEGGKEPLKSHIMIITHFLTAAANINQFETMYNRAFSHKNQLEMYLR